MSSALACYLFIAGNDRSQLLNCPFDVLALEPAGSCNVTRQRGFHNGLMLRVDIAGSGANGDGEWVRVVGLHELMTDDE